MLVPELSVPVLLLFASLWYFLPFLNFQCMLDPGMQVMKTEFILVNLDDTSVWVTMHLYITVMFTNGVFGKAGLMTLCA